MLKVIFSVKKRDDITSEKFHDYWKNTHAPLVASYRERLRIKRYVQSHTIQPELGQGLAQARGAQSCYDGVAELWWESLEDFVAVLEDQDANAALLNDEATFIDFERSSIQLAQEHEIFA